MAHAIDMTKGFAAIAYAGETPWHGLGTQVDPDLPLERWIEYAGLDYEVIKRNVFTNNLDGVSKIIANRRALLRSDTQDVLSIVAKDYKVVQPREVIGFFEDLIRQQGFKMHTAGVIDDGRRVWALAETGLDFAVGGKDPVLAYLLLATSYDGTFSTTAQFTSVSVVCNNTLSFALNSKQTTGGVIRIPHTADFDAPSVKAELGLIDGSFKNFQSQVERLADIKITKKQAVEFFLETLGLENDDDVLDEKQHTRTLKKILESYTAAPGQDLNTRHDTLWGVVGAVTHWADHARRAKSQETRLNSAWFGDSARLKNRAFELATKMAEAA